jgi:HEAT repeat protein
MRFDIASFLIGFVSASVLAFVLYRFRDRIGALRQNAEQRVGNTQEYITTSSEGRYLRDFTKLLNRVHLAGEMVELKEIYVEPHFIRPAEPVDPMSDDPTLDVFGVVPLLHDLPASYAPYNVETLSITDLQNGERHLALLGAPGIGKSVALAVIGLVAAGEIETQVIDLMQDQFFEEEIKELSPVERDKQIERRKQLQQRALEQLQEEKKRSASKTTTQTSVDFRRLLPIYIHLRDIDLHESAYGVDTTKAKTTKTTKQLDPAEPVVRALQTQFGALTASSLPHLVYRRLADGTCLVLIDGFDEVPTEMRPEKLAWLQQFMALYHDNFMIVAGPESGFGPLTQLGLTPIFLRAWNDADAQNMVLKWAQAWPSLDRNNKPIDEPVLKRVATNLRGRSALDITLKTWAAFAGDEQEIGRRGWYDFYIRRTLPANLNRLGVGAVAVTMLEKGDAPLSRETIKEIAVEALNAQGRTMSGVDDFVNKLTSANGVMVQWGTSGLYSFVHPLITAYIAAETLTDSDADLLEPFGEKLSWNLALAFAAAHLPVEKAVTKRLAQAPDLLYSGLFSLSHWLTDAPSKAQWKADVFRRLTAALLAPTQFPMVRERAMAGLVTSRDNAIIFIFRQALKNPDALVRRLGCIGLGAHGDPEVIHDLKAMLEDQNPDVIMAAGLALGAIGTEAALKEMITSIVYGEQGLRRAVAEALAALPGEGHAVLREAISAQDMMLRHAAVYGLARVKAGWSVALLYRTLLEDGEWYVRNAANEAFIAADSPEKSSVTKHPEADKLNWLAAWAATKGDSVPVGEKSRQVLIRTLQEGEPPIRAASAHTLATLGHLPALKPLYNALSDRDENVRAAAHAALGQLQMQLGEQFPAVN